MNRTRLARELVRAAMAFYDKALWRRLGNADVFAIRLPDQPLPLFASVMGAAGQEFGLCLYRGADALTTLRRMIAGGNRDEIVSAWDLLSVSMEPVHRVPPEFCAVLRDAGFSGAIAPQFMAKDPGRRVRPVRPAEQETLLWALAGLLQAEAAGLLRPSALSPFGAAAIWTLTLSAEAKAPAVVAKFERFAAPDAVPAAGPVLLPSDAKDLPRVRGHWLLGTPRVPAGGADDDRELRAVLIAQADGRKVLTMHATFEADPAQVAAVLFDVCRGHNALGLRGWPERIDIDNRAVHVAIAPALAEVGVKSDYAPSLPVLDEIINQFAESLRDGGEPSPEAAPAADDLQGWKEADMRLTQRLAERVRNDALLNKGLLARFFGGEVDFGGDEDEGSERRMTMLGAAIDWLVFHHRAGHRKTVAEKVLADPALPATERQLLQARIAAGISLYRVTAIQRGESLDLVDVLTGEAAVVHDRSGSATAVPDATFFARIYPAGAFRFFGPVSQILAPHTEAACAWLEGQGLELTRAGLQRAPHLLGRLWTWLDEQAARPTQWCNTDGEPLLRIAASYAIADAESVRARLLRRDDVEAGDGDGLIWFRAKGDQRTLLARLEFVGDQLVAEVNSEARLTRLNACLTGMPGVRPAGVTRSAFTAVPVDDQLRDRREVAAAPSEEMEQTIRDYLHRRMMGWLDEEIPALGHKTPRQAARTLAGRRQVIRMIRSMPDPTGPTGPIRGGVPRAAMLRELGLEAEAEGS